MNVGVIGLGAMGGPMTAALLAAGHAVTVFDIAQAALQRAVDAGASAAASPANVARASDVVLLSLPTPIHVERVVPGEGGVLAGAHSGLVVSDTSTVDPGTTRRVAAAAAEAGVGYLDSPVLGRPDRCGQWTFPVGGEAIHVEAARPVLGALATAVVHVGPSGSGNAIKLLNNLMFGAINAITAEVMAVSDAVGIDPRTFYDTVANSGAATVSPLFRHVGQKVVENDYSPVFTVDLLHKDVALALDMIRGAGGAAPIGEAVLDEIERARKAGHGGLDSAAVARLYQSQAGG